MSFAFVVLALLELSLRLLGVAAPEPLLVRRQQGPLDAYQINPDVGLRYFPETMERIMPKPGFQIFAAEKPPDSVRIFVLGGSTTAGFPYPMHGSFANLLRIHLQPHLPGTTLEVVNCGVTALNSYAVAEFVDELSAHAPDLYVVYMGHNEFYGALGPASRLAYGRSGRWVGALRWILDLRVSRLIGAGLSAARGDAERVAGQTLMGAMVGRTSIREGDAVWSATLEGFERNLGTILEEAGDVPVIFCEVASNLRDHVPFESLRPDSLPPEERVALDAELARLRPRIEAVARERVRLDSADSLSGPPDPGLDEDLGRLLAKDPEHAETVFQSARLALVRWARSRALAGVDARRERAPEAVRAAFERARDLDAIRFRAPGAINEILRDVVARARAEGRGRVALVPIEEAIDRRAAYGVPGADLFVEHLHPNLSGADQIARAILRQIEAEPCWPDRWSAALPLPPEVAFTRTGLTPLDLEIAERRVFHLTHRWPYPENSAARFVSSQPAEIQELARSVVEEDLDLAEAHYRLGETWFGQGRKADALRELWTSCEIFPVVPGRFLLAGRLALEEDEPLLAVDLLRRGSLLDPNDVELAEWRDRAMQILAGGSPEAANGLQDADEARSPGGEAPSDSLRGEGVPAGRDGSGLAR